MVVFIVNYTDFGLNREGYSLGNEALTDAFSAMRNCFDENVYFYNLEDDTCIFSDKLADLLGLPSGVFGNAYNSIFNLIYESDRNLYSSVMSLVKSKKRSRFMLEYRITAKDGSIIRVNDKANIIKTESNVDRILAGRLIFENGTAYKDKLTGLEVFDRCVHDYNSFLRRKTEVSGFLMKIGIDNMNAINERMGKSVGDKVIQIVAKCAQKALPKETFLYRGYEDDFMIMNLSGGTAIDGGKIYSTIKRFISESEHEIDYKVIFTISAGIVAFVSSATPFNDLQQRINFAFQYIKDHGKNSIKAFDSKEYKKHLDKFDLQEQLRLAIKKDYEGFKMYYQPLIDATKISENADDFAKAPVIGAEALLRWEHPRFGFLGAGEIIPTLEEFNLIVPLGRWILLTACRQCKTWNKYLPHFHMSINLSYVQIEKSDLVFDVRNALEKSGVNPENIVLEITESGSIDTDKIIPLLKQLRELGVGIDIDDFGTGYSNMRYLQEMNADTLKLDYTMIQKAVTGDVNSKDKVVVDHIARLAKDLNMKICMEGIESKEDVKKLIGLGPNKFQGFLFGSPMDADTFVKKKFNLPNERPAVDADQFFDENLSRHLPQS